MSLPKPPKLDDRRFQDLVDEAKRLIPHYCPEWTDHNVSDPGIAMIELFAWMTDLLLFRVNQVPDRMYLKFLEMIGVTLRPAQAAQAPVTFYLSAAQLAKLHIKRGTKVATVRTETSEAIIFTTERDLVISPPAILGFFTPGEEPTKPFRPSQAKNKIVIDTFKQPPERIKLFSAQPKVDDAFYLAFEDDHSQHVLALDILSLKASGSGINIRKPPLKWEVWQGTQEEWVPCEVETDHTGGFNESGEIVLYLPTMGYGNPFRSAQDKNTPLQGEPAFWLRCLIILDRNDPQNRYKESPEIEQITVEARGGTVEARQAITVEHEILGVSEGQPSATYQLANKKLLARDRVTDFLKIYPPKGEPTDKEQSEKDKQATADWPEEQAEIWQEVNDFASSEPTDCHYTLDSQTGILSLGPALLQPDGKLRCFGKIPAKGSRLRFTHYQYGGGIIGNVKVGSLSVLESQIPYIKRVCNRQVARGGLDAQSVEDARQRAPEQLRTHTRAVTADDYVYLVSQIGGVGRARCLAPLGPNDLDPKPGTVKMLVLPTSDQTEGSFEPDTIKTNTELKTAVIRKLEACQPLGITLVVGDVKLQRVIVEAELRLVELKNETLKDRVKQQAEAQLYRYINPYIGGPDGKGWPFNRKLSPWDLYGLLGRIVGVQVVQKIQLFTKSDADKELLVKEESLAIDRESLFCSGQHRIIFVES